MSQTLPAALATHLALDVTKLTVCWQVTRKDDVVIRGTAHDADITISSGTYAGTFKGRTAMFASDVHSTSDGSVSNLDVSGAFEVDAATDEIKVTDIEGGLYDQANAVLLMLNWASPNDGQKVLLAGTLGEFTRDSDGRYRSECRGLGQALMQQFIRTYSERCDVVEFGDSRCKLNISPLTRTGTVTAVENRKRFTVQLEVDDYDSQNSDVYYNGGRLKFTSGDNLNFIREVHVCQVDQDYDTAEILLWDETPADIAVDDTFQLPPGCDRAYDTCRLIHENLVNFRGHGIFATGRAALMRGPSNPSTTTAEYQAQLLTLEEYVALLDASQQTDLL